MQSFGPLKALYTLLPWQPDIQSNTISIHFYGKYSAMLQLMHKGYLYKYPPLPITRYSFI